MINRLEDRYYFQLADSRRRAAKYIKDNFFANDGSMLEVQNMDRNGEVILDYFEGLANLWRLGVLQDESVRYRFGMEAQRYWTLYKTAIKKAREEWKRPAVYEDLEQLARLMDNVDHQHGDPTEETSKEELHQFVEGEALVGVDPPTRE